MQKLSQHQSTVNPALAKNRKLSIMLLEEGFLNLLKLQTFQTSEISLSLARY